MYNKSLFYGRLTADPKLQISTTNMKAYCLFTIACNRIGTDKTDYINIRAYGKTAENLCKYQKKGSLILVEATTQSYQDDKKHHHQVLVANMVQYAQMGGYELDEPANEKDVYDYAENTEIEV